MDKTGVIYILTNPSFPEYVKIGYADDIDKRLQQLNRSECIPFAFRVYATYEVNSRLSDLKIHSIIDKLNPNLRSIENFNGKQRIREFYAMSPEDAYSILEAIAEIHGCADKLKRIAMDETQKQAEETGLPIVLLFTGTSWCGYCIKLEKEILSKKEFKQGMDGVAIGVKFEFGSSDFSKSKEAKTYRITGVPAMVVVDAEGKELGRTGYIPGQTPVQYVEFFKKYAPKTAEAK